MYRKKQLECLLFWALSYICTITIVTVEFILAAPTTYKEKTLIMCTYYIYKYNHFQLVL